MLRRNWREIVLAGGMALGALLSPAPARAQQAVQVCIPGVNTTTGGLNCQPVTGANPLPTTGTGGTVSPAPSASAVTATSVTCGSTSTALGVTGVSYLSVLIPPAASQNVCFAWGAGTATTSPPSQCFAPGVAVSWGGGTGACIVASGSQAITVESK